jgi:hypothetical protein
LQEWCAAQRYPDQFVNEARLLRFLKDLEQRPLSQRGRRSSKLFQMKTTRKINGKLVVVEKRDKDGRITYQHEDYAKIMTEDPSKRLSHHSIKVYVNALVHLYFWQTVGEANRVSNDHRVSDVPDNSQ